MNALVARRLCCLAWAIFFSLQAALAAPPANRPGARTSSSASSPAAPSPAQNRASWTFPSSKFITALCVDQQNNLWVGTEDEGIWRCPADGAKPQQFMPKDGLGDEHCYALACDTLGRVWAGHQSHGVSVWNGQKWQNYEVVGGLSRPDTLNGPLGERIFDIAVCPTDGDVWMATSLGLARYRLQQGEWQYFTRLEGLPSDQIQAIAFDKQGTLYAGTQCDGLAIAKGPAYAKWQVISGPDKLPLTPNGMGLPTNLINDVLVSRSGTIWVATTAGLACSQDKGKSYRFVRGADWAERIRGLYRPTDSASHAPRTQGEGTNRRIRAAQQVQKDPVQAAVEAGKDAFTLQEDYCTSLAEDAQGRLWVGHRQRPYEILDARTGEHLESGPDKRQVGKALHDQDHYVYALAASPAGAVVLGRYGEGLSLAQPDKGILPAAASTPSLFPVPAKSLNDADAQALLSRIKAGDRRLAKGEAVYLGEDWVTKGDWIGRYGRQYSVLCAADSPLNHYVAFGFGYEVTGIMGPHHDGKNSLRHWVHWTRTENPNTLWDPCVGCRRQAEWDDNGEVYPMTYEGPDIWAIVELPAGVHQIALYFFNKDGHEGNNRYRDYTLELKKWYADYAQAEQAAPLARARVRDFHGGHYKVFAANGPGKFLVKVGKNGSYNAILSAVLVDRLTGQHEGMNQTLYTRPMPWMGDLAYDPPKAEGANRPSLWSIVEPAGEGVRSLQLRGAGQKLAYRQAQTTSADQEEMLTALRWKACLWTSGDRLKHGRMMVQAWEAMKKLSPQLCDLGEGKE